MKSIDRHIETEALEELNSMDDDMSRSGTHQGEQPVKIEQFRKRPSTDPSTPPRRKRQTVERVQTLVEVLEKAPELPEQQIDFKGESSDALLAEILEEMEIKTQPATPRVEAEDLGELLALAEVDLVSQSETEGLESVEIELKVENNELKEIIDENMELTESGILPFFFLDAEEAFSPPDLVFLFGKVKSKQGFISCCVRVSGVERVLYFVPKDDIFREVVDLEKQYEGKELIHYLHEISSALKQEIYDLLRSRGVHKKISIKPVKRNYAFDDPRIPHGQQFVLKVKFQSTGLSLSNRIEGKHFQVVLGGGQNLLESVLLRRKMKGPDWVGIKQPMKVEKARQKSWCGLEVEITSHKAILASSSEDWIRASPPEVKILSLVLKTELNERTRAQEVIMANLLSIQKIKMDEPVAQREWMNSRHLEHLTGICKHNKQPWPPGFAQSMKRYEDKSGHRVCLLDSERCLLSFVLAEVHRLDPDVIVGHNTSSWDLSILFHRMQHNKVENWSQICRLRRTKYPSGSQHLNLAGRLVCDVHASAKEMIKEAEYTLTTLSKNLLSLDRQEMSFPEVQSCQELEKWILLGEKDAGLILGIMFHLSVLPLTKQLTNLSGSLWNKTLQGQRAKRIDFLLLHEFHRRKFLLPEKLDQWKEKMEEIKKPKRPQYAGGLVLEPKKGLYDKLVLLLDFNSLYPSIIQEYNICFTTVDRSSQSSHGLLPESSSSKPAPLPLVIKDLVDRRKQVKYWLKNERDPVIRQQLSIRQQALKLIANSMYGCLGFNQSRFFCKPMAELITLQGRDILQNTVDLVQRELNLEVIYGDTDSIMVNTGKEDYTEVMQLGLEMKKAINKKYRLLEMDIDGVFRSLLLLKKKKYAAKKLTFLEGGLAEEIEEKGLDTVRRDWSLVAKEAGNVVLREILSGKPKEEVVISIHEYLRTLRERMDSGILTLPQFVINKQLAKAPEDYPDGRSQPHVQVALRRKQQGKQEAVLSGEAIPYVICTSRGESGTGKSIAERAYHPEEVLHQPFELRIDLEYYLANQIHPVVSRLCAPIEGTDESRLAECLGLDGANYRRPKSSFNDNGSCQEAALVSSTGSLFDPDAQPLMLTLNGVSFEFGGVEAILAGKILARDVLGPPEHQKDPAARLSPTQLSNQVSLQARKFIIEYYDAWCKKEDETQVTRTVVYAETEKGLKKWKRIISERKLYLQLVCWAKQLDVDGALAKITDPTEKVEALENLKDVRVQFSLAFERLKRIKDTCQFGCVDMKSLLGI